MIALKKIKLVFMRIKSDFAVSKPMFIAYLIGTILSILVFTYFYGNFMLAFDEFQAVVGDEKYRTYSIHYTGSSSMDVTDFTAETLMPDDSGGMDVNGSMSETLIPDDSDIMQDSGSMADPPVQIDSSSADVDSSGMDFNSVITEPPIPDEDTEMGIKYNENVLNFLKEHDLERVDIRYTISKNLINGYDEPLDVIVVSNSQQIRDALKSTMRPDDMPEFSDKDFDSNIIFLGDKYKLDGKTISINGKELKVKTIKGSGYYSFIPANAFFKLDLAGSNNFELFDFVLKNRLSTDDNRHFREELTNLLYDNSVGNVTPSVSDPYTTDADGQQDKNNTIMSFFLLLCLIFAVSFIFCAMLFNYIARKNMYENIIYTIVGAKRKTVLLISLFENIVLSLISSIAAVIIHISLYNSVFTAINRYDISYGITDYLIITALVTVLSAIIMLPFFINITFRSSITLKNKYS